MRHYGDHMRISLDIDAIESILTRTSERGDALSSAISPGLASLSQARQACFNAATPVTGEISRIWGARKDAVVNVDAYVLQMATRVELALGDSERNEDEGLADIGKMMNTLEKGMPAS